MDSKKKKILDTVLSSEGITNDNQKLIFSFLLKTITTSFEQFRKEKGITDDDLVNAGIKKPKKEYKEIEPKDVQNFMRFTDEC